jgi:hypothetical protein
MTRDEIIRMAREAGLDDFFCRDLMLERFAALVAAAERDACAKVCDEIGGRDSDSHAWDAAAAIRARGGDVSDD